MTHTPLPTVALIGANGHGLWHRRQLASRQDAGLLRVVALCDVGPVGDAPDAPVPSTAAVFTDHRTMLANARPDVVIICTPPHTHLAIATDAARAGCDILLEKPPVLSLAEHDELARVLSATGRACQIGFQALGSAALSRLLDAIAGGGLGAVTGIAAVASWQRPDAYYTRAPWAGRRSLNGRPVVDGALVNPLAHAVMQCLAVAVAAAGSGELASVELERYRTRPIEVEDTGFLRARTHSGLPITVAVTLCGEDFVPGEIVVSGSAGRAVLEYPTDRLALPGSTEPAEVPGRISLLDDLLAHRATGSELIVPLARTRSFTALLEAVVGAPPPAFLGLPFVTQRGEHRVIEGINNVLRACAAGHALPHELGLRWSQVP